MNENVPVSSEAPTFAPVPAPAAAAVPLQAVVQQDGSRRARDGAQYVRQQKGHSLTLHLLFGAFVLWIPTIYYTLSPRHYWHT